MIGKGQATYLRTLISQYAEAREHSYYINGVHCYDKDWTKQAEDDMLNAKRKLDNYIAKLTETGK